MVAGVPPDMHATPPRECSTCAFWLATGRFVTGRIAGECRRFPPTRIVVPAWKSFFAKNFDVNNSFPTTATDRWCGEWKEHNPR
jgi:hypothetical protein